MSDDMILLTSEDSQELKQLRNNKLLTQPELAEKAQVSPRTIWEIENIKGSRSFRRSIYRSIREALFKGVGQIKRYSLVPVTGPGKEIPLCDGVYQIGRVTPTHSPDIPIPEKDLSASRRHAQLTVGTTGLVVEDLGSYHGTIVNGKETPKHASTTLRDGDYLRCGQTEWIVRKVDDPWATEF